MVLYILEKKIVIGDVEFGCQGYSHFQVTVECYPFAGYLVILSTIRNGYDLNILPFFLILLSAIKQDVLATFTFTNAKSHFQMATFFQIFPSNHTVGLQENMEATKPILPL